MQGMQGVNVVTQYPPVESSAMAFVVYICALFASVNAEVFLKPTGNVSVCAIGSEISLNCLTEGPLVWRIATGTQLFSGQQAPATEGRFSLVVNSANPIEGNMAVLRINSTASLSDFQPELDSDILIRCREVTTGKEKEVVLRFAGAPKLTLSKLNSTSFFISWNSSACMQYVITIINSSDDSVYPNITTSDTNTTVTLPTGVEFCVTVLGVDSINRTGPASEPQCYSYPGPVMVISPSPGGSTAATPSSTPPPLDQSSGGAIAGAVIAAIVIILAVLATVAVIVFVIYWKGNFKSDKEPLAVGYTKEYQCVCHTFCQDVGLNSWKVVFVFIPPEIDLEAMKMFYKDFEVYGSPFDCHLKSSGTIQVKVLNKPDKWTVYTSDFKVHKADIAGYTGVGSPPHIEMLITAASNKTTPPDLTVEAKLKGVQKPTIIKFEKEAQNVVECVCQVFYHMEALNHWRARVAFFPKCLKEKVNQLYQDANNCSPFDVKFPGSGVIKISTNTVVPDGWEVTVNQQHQQVTTAAVEQYTGEGEPPYCEMTLRATDNADSRLIKQPVTLIGIREQPRNTFYVERVLEKSDGTLLYDFPPTLSNVNSPIVCQVFYHKEGINYWKATLAFFTENKMDRVQQLYQDANLGKKFKVEKFIKIYYGTENNILVIKPIIILVANGWNIGYNDFKMTRRTTVLSYDGVGKPPYCEVTFKAISDDSTPPDLTVTIIFGDVKKPTNTFTISRVAETPEGTVCHSYSISKVKGDDVAAAAEGVDYDNTKSDLDDAQA